MMYSGVLPLDHHLGGVQSGRLHLLTGGPGTGKTTACLQFLHAGLREDDTCVLFTADRTSDVVSHARSIGLHMDAFLRSERLLVARFREPFGELLASNGTATMLDELSRLIEDICPARAVIDPLTPFLSERSAAGGALAAALGVLDSAGCTTLLTYHNDVSQGYDARVMPIVQNAASIVHLTREAEGVHHMRAVQTRWRAAPPHDVRFACAPGAGLVLLGDNPIEVVLR
jgi:KaiC/GvpD/RAD55 family RecA-like ATPase